MLLLMLDTCGNEGFIALASEAGVLAEERLPGRGSSEQLLPMLRLLFDTTEQQAGALSAVAVVHGPGSFTGVRVGLSAAKGLCDAVGCPLLAISRLWLLGTAQPGAFALLDAGRGEFFAGWRGEEHGWQEQLLKRDEVRSLLGARPAVCCEQQVLTAVDGDVTLIDPPGPEAIWMESLRRIAAGIWSDVAEADANYLRRTDAELLRERC